MLELNSEVEIVFDFILSMDFILSSNVNEAIKTISNLFIFFTRKSYTPKKHKKH